MKNSLINKPYIGLFVSAVILFISFSITYTLLVLNDGQVLGEGDDTLPPEIVSLTINTPTINTQSAEATVTITLRITDDLSGSDGANVRIGPLNRISPLYYLTQTRISGDEFDGIYEFTGTIPMGSKKGTWQIESINFGDAVGNSVDLNLEQIEQMFGAGSGRFTNLATTDDGIAPVLKSLAIASGYRTFNTESGPALFEMTFSLQDNMSGVSSASVMFGAGAYGDNINRQVVHLNVEEIGVSGLTKTYKGSVTLPQYSKNGYWIIESISARDAVGNQVDVNYPELTTFAGLTNTRANNLATIVDITAPTVKSLTVSPTEFDTSQGPAVLNIEIVIEDDLVGLGDNNSTSVAVVRYHPLISTQFREAALELTEVISPMEHRYTGTITFPQYSKAGVWEVGVGTGDILNNSSNSGQGYDANYINANVPNAKGISLINTARANEVTIERDWTISSSLISVTFPNGTVVSKEQGGAFGFYRMVNKAYDVEQYDTFEELLAYINSANQIEVVEEIIVTEEDTLEDLSTVCLVEEGCVESVVTDEDILGTPVGAVRIGVPGLNINFSKPVSVSVNVDPKYNGWFLTIQTFEEGGEAWANETTCQVVSGKCTFTTNHASFFSANVIPDTKAPKGSMTINANASVTTSKLVKLYLYGTDDSSGIKYMRFSNNGTKWTKWLAYSSKYSNWNLTSSTYGGTSAEGTRNIYVQFKDRTGKISKTISNNIIYNPRKVTPITVYRARRAGTGNSEYVIIRNNLRGTIALKNWRVKNNAGTAITLPKASIGASKTITLYTGKGTNNSSRIYFQKSSKTNFWRDKGDAIRLYTEKGAKLLGKTF